MNIVLVLIPLSLVLAALAVWAFFWGVDHAQFDDLDTPALMPLSDEVAAPGTIERTLLRPGEQAACLAPLAAQVPHNKPAFGP